MMMEIGDKSGKMCKKRGKTDFEHPLSNILDTPLISFAGDVLIKVNLGCPEEQGRIEKHQQRRILLPKIAFFLFELLSSIEL